MMEEQNNNEQITDIDQDNNIDANSRAEKNKTFTQEEVNGIVSKRIERIEKRYEKIISDADAARTRETDITARENALAQREIRFDAINVFKVNGYSEEFADTMLKYLSIGKDTKLDDLMKILKDAFQVEQERMVNQRLGCMTPPKRGNVSSMKDDEFKNIFCRK
jgi:hypothetical protein